HLLRERQAAQQRAGDVGEHVDRRLATLPDAIREIGPLRRVAALERPDIDAVLARESGSGGRWLPIGRKRCRYGRSGDQVFEVRLSLGESRHTGGQTTRCAEGFDGTAG